jgi:plastocyanin
MIARVTPTLVICAVGAAVTGGLLGLPPATSEVSTAPPGSAPAGAPSVEIAGFEFGAARAAAGATVSVVNADAVAHTLSAGNGAFGTGVLDAGATGSFVVPSVPGTYEIVCQIHPTMTGTLVVD